MSGQISRAPTKGAAKSLPFFGKADPPDRHATPLRQLASGVFVSCVIFDFVTLHYLRTFCKKLLTRANLSLSMSSKTKA